MGLIGYIVNIYSLIEMTPIVLNLQQYFLTYKFSQDHLELFFSAVRGAGIANFHMLFKELYKMVTLCDIYVNKKFYKAKTY